MLGAVAYAPKVVTIWEGFREWFAGQGLRFDYVLYSNYERMVEDLVDGHLDVAWNSPLAWVRACRLAAVRGRSVRAVAMRDADCGLRSVVVVRRDSPVNDIDGLRGATVGVGAVDSPQATLLPVHHLRQRGLDPQRDVKLQIFDVLGGKHGDHVGGERDAVLALQGGEIDAACLLEVNHRAFEHDGTVDPGSTRVVTRTEPFDHCNFTAIDGARAALVDRFAELLLGMSYEDDEVRRLLDLEGLRRWLPGRSNGYDALDAAVDEGGFYDAAGRITAAGYRY